MQKIIKNLSRRQIVYGCLFFFVLCLYIFTRLSSLHLGFTADEPNWINRSLNFASAIFLLDPNSTYQAPHPGVITMIAAGVLLTIKHIFQAIVGMENIGVSITQTDIVFSRVGLFFLHSLYIGILLYITARRFKRPSWSLFLFILLALEPYIIRLSRVTHVDTVISYPLAIASLYLLLFVQEKQKTDLTKSFIFFALALLNKTPAVFFIFYSLGILVMFYKNKTEGIWLWIRGLAIALFTYMLLWPKMWINPLSAIKGMLMVADPGINKLHSLSELNPFYYGETFFYFISPIYLGLCALSIVLLFYKRNKEKFLIMTALSLFALGFIVFMTMFTKKADRYAMPSVVFMALISSFVLSHITKESLIRVIVVSTVLLMMYFKMSIALHPYYFTYYNSWSSKEYLFNRFGWGEGLEEAAYHLNAEKDAHKLTVAAWYDSVFAPYFKGTTKDISVYKEKNIDYVVTYGNMYKRADDHIGTIVLHAFESEIPVKTFSFNGIPYVWVYKTK